MPSYFRTDGLKRVGAAYRGKPILDAQQVEDVVAYLQTLKALPDASSPPARASRSTMTTVPYAASCSAGAAAPLLALVRPAVGRRLQPMRPRSRTSPAAPCRKPAGSRSRSRELVDNGNAVPVTVSVDSPMSAGDHVTAIAHLQRTQSAARRRPLPRSTRAPGKAEVSTRIRLATSQKLVAVAAHERRQLLVSRRWTSSSRWPPASKER